MRNTLALLILTSIAISSCKKETPKKTPVQELIGKKFIGYSSFPPLYTISYSRNLEFKSDSELIYYEVQKGSQTKPLPTTYTWEPIDGSENKIRMLMNHVLDLSAGMTHLDYLTGEIKGDSLVTSYNGDGFYTFKQVKD